MQDCFYVKRGYFLTAPPLPGVIDLRERSIQTPPTSEKLSDAELFLCEKGLLYDHPLVESSVKGRHRMGRLKLTCRILIYDEVSGRNFMTCSHFFFPISTPAFIKPLHEKGQVEFIHIYLSHRTHKGVIVKGGQPSFSFGQKS